MTKQELIEFIFKNNIVQENGQYNRRKLNNKNIKKIILSEINQYTKKCNNNALNEKIYWIVNNLDDYPKKCLNCKKSITVFNTWNHPYPTSFCSVQCSSSYEKTRRKREETNLIRYGHKNAGASKIIQKRIQETNIKKYGIKTTFLVKEIQEKIKKTMIERYGVDHNMKNKKIRNKIKKTNLKKYGVDNVFKSEIFQQKAKKTMKEKYNVECIFERVDFIKNNTLLMKKRNYYKLQEILEKRNIEILSDIETYINDEKCLFKCKNCNTIIETKPTYLVRCFKCNPKYHSKQEDEIFVFIENMTHQEIIRNDRKIIAPYELDILIPEKKLAIEYCGLYWHSEQNGKDKNYHRNKMIACQEKGIRLITIFEDEWINKRNICEDRLKYILGVYNKQRIFARNTKIKEIPPKDYKKFLLDYHIQGYVPSKIKIGAYYNDELVSVMGFSKARRALGNKSNNIELLRFCSKYNVVGVASKLFKYFIKYYSPQKVISYCDLRWGTGSIYETLGFKRVSITDPNYFYTKDGINRYHRYKFRKSELISFENFSNDKTENQIMDEAGFYKIWDCGHLKFEWKNELNCE